MGHYSNLYNETIEQDRKQSIEFIKQQIETMSIDDIRFIKKIIINLKSYQQFEKHIKLIKE